ncbi:hypothetical protein B1808_03230, partial [Pseudofulvimonas gallinarii]|uniref:choice-of-anchor Q domain-containing protein n=1 Tax=Pseudofulvimonas gallinarii TaxID=634155 RepID=UPI001139F85C
FKSSGYNRFQQGDDSCDLVATDPYLADPMLLPLGNYGGAAPVMLPRIDSVLIDVAGTACGGITSDARGHLRPVSSTGSGTAHCDVGAVEWNPAFDDYLFKHGLNY